MTLINGDNHAAEEAARRQREAALQAQREAEQQQQRLAEQNARLNEPPPPPPPEPMSLFAERTGVDSTFTRSRFEFRFAGVTEQPTSIFNFTGTPDSIERNSNPLPNITGGDLPPATNVPSPDELALATSLNRVERANNEAQQVFAALPPDTAPVALRANPNVSYFDQWRTGAYAALGSGDTAALDRYFNDNRQTLDTLGRIIDNTPPRVSPFDAVVTPNNRVMPEQLYRPVIAELQRNNPGAHIEIVALRGGTLPASAQSPFATTSPFSPTLQSPFTSRSELAISVTNENPDGTTQTRYLALDENVIQRRSAEISQAFQNPNATGEPNLSNILFDPRNRQNVPLVVANGLMEVNIRPEQIIVQVNADQLRSVASYEPISTTINIAGAENLNKTRNFINQNPQVVINPTFTQYLELRGDTPRQLSGAALINEIGMTMNMPPNNAPSNSAEEAALNQGEWEFYTGDQRAAIEPIAQAIREAGGDSPQVTAMPIFFESKETGLVQLPLFRVTTASGEERFVDNVGRTYDDMGDWRDNNQLPPGQVTYAADGHLTGTDGRANLITEKTHAVKDTFWEHVAPVLDVAALVGGTIAGVVILVGSGGTAAPFVLGAAAAYGAARSGENLYDRHSHGQTLSLSDAGARADWLSFGGNIIGVGALGASVRLSGMLARGVAVSTTAQRLTTGLGVASQLTDTVAVADLSYNLAINWDRMTPQERTTQIAQIGFWGAMTGAQARQPGGIQNLYSADGVNNFMQQTRQQLQTLDPRSYTLQQVTTPDGRTFQMIVRRDPSDVNAPMRMDGTGGSSGTSRLSAEDQQMINSIAAYREQTGLPEFRMRPGESGTIAQVEINGQRIYGHSTTLERAHLGTDNRALREEALAEIQSRLNKLSGVRYGDQDAMFLTHAEAEALIQAHNQFGTLPEQMTLYVDRPTCNACRGQGSADKGLSTLAELYGIRELTVVDSYGNRLLVRPNQPTVKLTE